MLLRSLLKSDKLNYSLDESFCVQARLLNDHKEMTIFDIGAYIGEVASKYAGIFPNAHIYAFEPFPESFEKLTSKSKNTLIKPYNCAVSDNVGSTKLYVNADPSCNSFFPRPTDSKRYYSEEAKNIGHIEVSNTTVDHFCNG